MYGLTEECAAIIDATGLAEEKFTLPSFQPLIPDPPLPIMPMQSNWPILPMSQSLLERALIDENGDILLEEPAINGFTDGLTTFEKDLNGVQGTDLINVAEDGATWDEVDDGAGTWDLGDGEGDEDIVDIPEPQAEGISDVEYWIRSSPLAADHIAAGSFNSAMKLLNRQVGAVNFGPLKPKFMQIYWTSRTFLSANPGLPPLEFHLRHDQRGVSGHLLPRLPWDFEKIKSVQMREAFKYVTNNKVEEAITTLRDVLHTILLLVVWSKQDADEFAKTVETIREYLVGLSIEVARRNVDVSTPEGVKRNLELAAYFTHSQLSPQHQGLAYMQAMTQFSKYKNIATAGAFAQKYLALNIGKPEMAERVCWNERYRLTGRQRKWLCWPSEIREIQLKSIMTSLRHLLCVQHHLLRFIKGRLLFRTHLLGHCISQSTKESCVV
jgi:coatomer protein complex subunit alpha (xenin)